MRKLLGILLFVTSFTSYANAGFMIEPYVGFETGDAVVSTAGGDFTSKISGVGYGARLGYHFIMAWVALEYSGSSGQKSAPETGESLDASQTGTGIAVGVDIPMGFRFFGGYGVSYEGKLTDSSGATNKYKGTYSKVGVGFKIIPKVALNVEYRMNTPTKYVDSAGTESTLSEAGFTSYKHNPLFVSISVPL